MIVNFNTEIKVCHNFFLFFLAQLVMKIKLKQEHSEKVYFCQGMDDFFKWVSNK